MVVATDTSDGNQRKGRVSALLAAVVLLVLGGVLAACVSEPSPVTGKRQAYGFSWEQELAIGKETDQQIIQEFGLYDDPAVQAYVTRVGNGVLQKSDLRDANAPEIYRSSPFTFRVLDSPVVNAFALPGGYVYVTRGLLTHLDNEAQLAVVLGHEIAHVAARHSARQTLKSQVGQLGLMGGMILGSVLGDGGISQQAAEIASGALQALNFKYSRDDEREADRLGIAYAAQRGYAVEESADFFTSLRRLGEKDGARLPSWLSTHPDPGEREVTARQLAQKYERPNAGEVVAQDEYLQRLQGMVVGENPREGFTRNGIFYHPEMAFQFPVPAGWEVKNDKSAVILSSANQQALMALELVPARTAREAAARFAQQQGLNVVQSGSVDTPGKNAYAVVGQANTQQGQVGVAGYFFEHGGRVFNLTGLSGVRSFDNYRPVFQNTLSRFTRITDPQILKVQPSRIQIVTTDRSAPFSSFLPTSATPGITPEELAILNQVTLQQEIKPGTKLKIPR